MKKVVKWIFILVPIVLLGMIIVNLTGLYFGGNLGSPFQHSSQQFGHQFQQFGQHSGGHPFEVRGGRYHEIIYGQASFFYTSMLLIIAKIGLALAGWLIWRNSKEKGGKITGVLLFILAVFLLLPKFIGIPFLLLVGYLGYKGFQKNSETSFEHIPALEFGAASASESQYKTRDFLDEWEKSIRKEEK